MKTVVTTGCPYSQWQKILPILHKAGFGLGDDTFCHWHDELFKSAGKADPLRDNPPWKQNFKISACLQPQTPKKPAPPPTLFADERTLWLLDYWAARLPEAQFILFYSSAETALEKACIEGIDAFERIEQWQTVSHQLVTFYRRNRRRTLLLDAEAAIGNPQAMIEAFKRIDINLKPLSKASKPIAVNFTVERLLARELLSTLPDVQALQAQLSADAHPLGDMATLLKMQPIDLLNDHVQRLVAQRALRQVVGQMHNKLQRAKQSQKEQNTYQKRLRAQLGQLFMRTTSKPICVRITKPSLKRSNTIIKHLNLINQ
jgi:FtsZ-binding cell division protein ZapB